MFLILIIFSYLGMDFNTCEIETAINEQNSEIANGVHMDKHEEDIGAGDQVNS